MKLLIASDIHGDALCCKKMLEAAEAHGVQKTVILGDILYHGPRNNLPDHYAPKQVISMLNEVADKLICVRGNCDTEVDQMVLNFPILSTTGVIYDGEQDITLYLSHGHLYSPENLPPISGKAAFLYGHTHLVGFSDIGATLCLNPGSVSLPKGGNPKTYALYDSGKFSIFTLDGELKEVRSI